MRTSEGRVSAGLVSATDGAIHTTQMQVDEVTVIRLSPIVYNKESMKRELLDLLKPFCAPHPTTQSNQYQYKKQRETERGRRKTAGKHASL